MNASSPFLVLLDGELTVTERLRARARGWRAVAADGGMRHAEALGVAPELWVGDFDSTPASLDARWRDVPRLPYPQGKNETDGEIAVGEALKRGAGELVLAGALGGSRSDHALFHLLHGCRLRASGTPVLVTSGEEEATPLAPGRQTFDLPRGSLFSIVGFSELRGITLEGARYPLEDYTLRFGSSRTISNVVDGPVAVTLGSGTAVFIARPYDLSGA